MRIKSLKARQILNSRNEAAIEVIVNGKFLASAPSGASTGSSEVPTFSKKGIKFAIDYINNDMSAVTKLDFNEFNDLDVFERLIPVIGGNPVVALQNAILKTMSDGPVWKFLNPSAKKFPIPLGNVVGGGMHTKHISTDVQEYLLMPTSKNVSDNIMVNSNLHKKIGNLFGARDMTDEGAWTTHYSSLEVFEMISNLLQDTENTLGIKVNLGADIASTSFWDGRFYVYKNYSQYLKDKSLNPSEQIGLINELVEKYSLAYVEDPLHENDFSGFTAIKSKKTLICGDDLITTNIERLQRAMKSSSVNCVIVKPNQIGSITQTKRFVDYAIKNDIKCVLSHRSGETMDPILSHFAVAWNIPYLKCGIYGKERVAKLKELELIQEQM